MEDAHQEITDKLDRELNRYIAQYAALFMLNEELDMLLRSESLQGQIVDCETVSLWLLRLQEMVNDAMQEPHNVPHGDGSEPAPALRAAAPDGREGDEFRLAAGTS